METRGNLRQLLVNGQLNGLKQPVSDDDTSSDQFLAFLDTSSATSSMKFRQKKKKKPTPFKPPSKPIIVTLQDLLLANAMQTTNSVENPIQIDDGHFLNSLTPSGSLGSSSPIPPQILTSSRPSPPIYHQWSPPTNGSLSGMSCPAINPYATHLPLLTQRVVNGHQHPHQKCLSNLTLSDQSPKIPTSSRPSPPIYSHWSPPPNGFVSGMSCPGLNPFSNHLPQLTQRINGHVHPHHKRVTSATPSGSLDGSSPKIPTSSRPSPPINHNRSPPTNGFTSGISCPGINPFTNSLPRFTNRSNGHQQAPKQEPSPTSPLVRPKCISCDSLIVDEECTEAEGGVYHIKCFICSSCTTPLGGLQYIMHLPVDHEPANYGRIEKIQEHKKHDLKPFCTKCYDSLFGEYCEGCGTLIPVAKGSAITHEGRSWHAIDSCFCCYNCSKSLLGQPFLPHSSGLIFCSIDCSKSAFECKPSANTGQEAAIHNCQTSNSGCQQKHKEVTKEVSEQRSSPAMHVGGHETRQKILQIHEESNPQMTSQPPQSQSPSISSTSSVSSTESSTSSANVDEINSTPRDGIDGERNLRPQEDCHLGKQNQPQFESKFYNSSLSEVVEEDEVEQSDEEEKKQPDESEEEDEDQRKEEAKDEVMQQEVIITYVRKDEDLDEDVQGREEEAKSKSEVQDEEKEKHHGRIKRQETCLAATMSEKEAKQKDGKKEEKGNKSSTSSSSCSSTCSSASSSCQVSGRISPVQETRRFHEQVHHVSCNESGHLSLVAAPCKESSASETCKGKKEDQKKEKSKDSSAGIKQARSRERRKKDEQVEKSIHVEAIVTTINDSETCSTATFTNNEDSLTSSDNNKVGPSPPPPTEVNVVKSPKSVSFNLQGNNNSSTPIENGHGRRERVNDRGGRRENQDRHRRRPKKKQEEDLCSLSSSDSSTTITSSSSSSESEEDTYVSYSKPAFRPVVRRQQEACSIQ